MIEVIFVCSIVTTVFTSCVFIYTLSEYGDSKKTANKIIKLSREVEQLRTKLTEERHLRIEAEQNAKDLFKNF